MPQARCYRPIVAISFISFLAAAASGAGLSDRERRLAEVIDDRESGATALLQAAVEINSGTLNRNGVRKVGALFSDALGDLGFETRWVDGTDFDRAGHLIARHPGDGPHLLLIGHLDTVFEPDSPFQDFERLGPDRARGPGIIDMKGGNVVIVEAVAPYMPSGY